MMTRGSWTSSRTMDVCLQLWHRVGGRQFRAWEVKDPVSTPSQLASMKNRGYLKVVGLEPINTGKQKYWAKVWQMTDHCIALMEAEEGIRNPHPQGERDYIIDGVSP